MKIRTSAAAEEEETKGLGPVIYQVIRGRMVRQISSGIRIRPAQAQARAVSRRIRRDMERLRYIDRRMASEGTDYTAADIADEFRRFMADYPLLRYMQRLALQLRQSGKYRTSETYTAAAHSFRKFLSEAFLRGLTDSAEDIMPDCLTAPLLEAYQAWHKLRGNSMNTISFYMRILRAVYNRLVEADIIEDRRPFRRVYTGVDKTVKRALPLALLRRIKALDLSHTPALGYARDMFMLSLYLRGMSFIDMAFLRKSDLRYGSLTYRRRKTGQQLTIAWTAEMQAIISKHPRNASPYLLPIISTASDPLRERSAYRNAAYNINRNLRRVAALAGITTPLTLYVARHSWASTARAKGIPLSVISEAMGHDSEATTRIYLASLEASVVDKANALIIKSI